MKNEPESSQKKPEEPALLNRERLDKITAMIGVIFHP